jgi:hypothetical protein
MILEYLFGAFFSYTMSKCLDYVIFSKDIDRQLYLCLGITYAQVVGIYDLKEIIVIGRRTSSAMKAFDCSLSQQNLVEVFRILHGQSLTVPEIDSYVSCFHKQLAKRNELKNYCELQQHYYNSTGTYRIAIDQKPPFPQLPDTEILPPDYYSTGTSRIAIDQKPPFPQLPDTEIVPPRINYRSEGNRIGRNDPCPCGSGKKYKNCHGKNE